ncbi:hypothetical protein ACYTUN_27435 [Escherichia coli]
MEKTIALHTAPPHAEKKFPFQRAPQPRANLAARAFLWFLSLLFSLLCGKMLKQAFQQMLTRVAVNICG